MTRRASTLLLAGALLLAGCGAPGPTPLPSGGVAIADLAPLAVDGAISDGDLAHDSRDDAYRTPPGAVPAGTEVTIRLRAAAGDLSEATLRVYDALTDTQLLIPMAVEARDATAGDHGYDWWATTLHTTKVATLLWYRFIVRDGGETRYVEDDALLDGGAGTVASSSEDASWELATYDPAFATPAWAQGATVYQVFPDRFANGDPSNDPSPDATPGSGPADRYRSGEVYGNPVLAKAWDDLPEGYCRAYQSPATACAEQPLGRDFFGGDLAGITAHIGELADLGVTVLYLNPVFAAPSNHRYDTQDYTVVDPDLGTNADLDALLAAAEAHGMHVVLDGVFNHTSSDAPTFDRSHHFPEVGACEAADSPYATWYVLTAGPPAKCFGGQSYTDWFGFDTLAVLSEHPDVYAAFFGRDGIVPRWIRAGIGGWRLDVMNEIGHAFLRGMRREAKAANPDALILGEEWNDASAWLLGTEADSVMNYRFRRAVIGLINGDTADSDGAIAGLTPSEFASVMEGVREDYPPPAWNVLDNLVDSHDTTRILWTLTPGADNREAKEAQAALAEGKAKLRLLAALQLTWPGMAGIYYGDEVGLTGHDDPDDRRTYPWGAEDAGLRDWYRTLANLRRDHEALRTGDLRFLLTDDDGGTLAFGRRTDGEAAVVALNTTDAATTVRVPVDGWLPDDAVLTDAISGESATVTNGAVSLDLEGRGAAVLLTAAGIDLAAPLAPENLSATASTGRVDVAWNGVEGAADYVVWRSLLAGGGYSVVGTVSGTSFSDATVRNGVRYHYVVTAVDAAGNPSPRSAEATALPEVTVAEARLDAPQRVEQTLSAVEPGAELGVLVRADDSGAAGATIGIGVELGFGPPDADPAAADSGWTWAPARYAADAGGMDRFVGSVRPEAAGDWPVAARVTTDGGVTWQLVDRTGIGWSADDAVTVAAAAGADVEPPAAPERLVVTSVSDSAITLGWQPVAADDLYRYLVIRSDADGGTGVPVGAPTEPTFTDDSVAGGRSYVYEVVAQDTSFNSSDAARVTAAAETREVAVTFTVSVPETTPPGDTVFIAGDFQGWDPGATPMTRVDATHWTITLPFTEGTPPQYKYTRGSWDAVEKDAGCAEIENRTFNVTFGTEGEQGLGDTVAKWRDVDACG
jgi:glycosidase